MFLRLSNTNLSVVPGFNNLLNDKCIVKFSSLLQSNIKCRNPENTQSYNIISYDKKELNNDNIPTHGLCRSVIINSENKVICYSPPKSINVDDFCSKYKSMPENIITQQLVEGTMINVFWDNSIGLWEISTKNTVGATSNFFKSQNSKTFRQMFFEAAAHCKLSLDQLDTNYCYSFVLQHPENRIVVQFTQPCLYLIAIYSIDNTPNDISVYSHDIYDSKTQDFFSRTSIKFPHISNKSYDCANYSDLFNLYASKSTPVNELGVVIYNKATGERTKIRNPGYENIRQLRGNQPKLQFHYLTLRSQGKVNDFLKFYPENKKEFSQFREQVHLFTNMLFQNYINCYIKKEKPLGEYNHQYKTHMFNIHKKYVNELKEKNLYVTNSVVIEYVNNLPPQLLMYCLNYELRKPISIVSDVV